jgi:hypothetical protein
MAVLIKIHENYRKVVAICDSELLGKKFEEGKLQLNVNEFFYNGKEYEDSKALKVLENAKQDDACFNFVGQDSVNLGVKLGIIDKNCVLKIQGVQHALSLL